ncbi:MAG: hypothetical protein KBE04_06245 [Phycisphaerae bacterium]|nr:hypothetical protein [Phycisphaerae bacterium]
MGHTVLHRVAMGAALCLLVEGHALGQVMIDPDLAGWVLEFLGPCPVSNTSTNLLLRNCTIADNEAMSGGALPFFGGPLWPASEAQVVSSILFGGAHQITVFDGSVLQVTYSDIQGGWTGAGNVDTDPLFVRRGSRDSHGIWEPGDYHLQGGSPCIDAGDPRFQDETSDLDGDPRILGGVVEMGADERFPLNPLPSL